MTEIPTTVAASAAEGAAAVARLEANVARVYRGRPESIRLAVVAMLARGHVLIEDVPGVGKTTLAQALARSLGLSFQRIQFTSDLLPSDILGVSIWNQRREAFEHVPGPIFASIVLADEINRATPKTQSALLEAMSERKVTVERQRIDLPDPFLVLATQNPHEYLGTFPLPESQLDRFEMHLRLGYPSREQERDLLLGGGVESELEHLPVVLAADEVRELQRRAAEVRVAPAVADYLLALAERTRR
ncbi:MAG: AAA domain-containing protein, partial [Thermoanaerobaculia bacterium]